MTDPLKPVHPAYVADPFVLRVDADHYYAFGTAGPPDPHYPVPADRRFPLLFSRDLEHWEFLGGALIPPADPSVGTNFWAPEVTRGDDGRFYLYYSVGPDGEMLHQLRVAVSERPEGPYEDINALTDLTLTPFAIDAHPFRDANGTWYLFYARDFLDSDHGFYAGTGLAMDRLINMTSMAGEERIVMRARHPWQLYMAQRHMGAYGGRVFDWHTLEGAFVLPHAGRYFCLYSGSAYGTERYGVDFAVADSITGPWSDAGGEGGPRVLQTIPDILRGPGHCSVVVGPDDRQYVVFHAWDPAHERRQMHIAALHWTEDGPRSEPEKDYEADIQSCPSALDGRLVRCFGPVDPGGRS